MTHAADRAYDAESDGADVAEQLTPVALDDDDEDALSLTRVRLSPTSEADEADLLEQAIDVPFDDDRDSDR